MAEAAIDGTDVQVPGVIRGVRTADPEAWRVLYDALGEAVFRMLHRMTGDPDLALDLTHDTFLTVAERGPQFTGRGSLRGWVFRIAANLAKERLRRDRARNRHDVEILVTRADRSNAPDTELRIVVRNALEGLTDGERMVVLLHDVDGYTHPEIAEMLTIAEGTSKARLSRARARLREVLRRDV